MPQRWAMTAPHPLHNPHLKPLAFSTDRRLLRFVWQMDRDGRYTVDSDEFITVMGPPTAALMGHTWSTIASTLGLDPDRLVENAIATRETWSGLSVAWPVNGGDDRIRVELSGLPVYDRERTFCGYRGFGICRDLGRLDAFAQTIPADASAIAVPRPPHGVADPAPPLG
jgi:hypothetical protein